jgi:hypothetical protein
MDFCSGRTISFDALKLSLAALKATASSLVFFGLLRNNREKH